MRSVVVTMDVAGTYVIDLFEGAVRVGSRTVEVYHEIGGIIAHWLTQKNVTVETDEEDDEVRRD